MADTTDRPRFRTGDQVVYMGRQFRLQGQLFHIDGIAQMAPGEARYSLRDEVWGIRLPSVSESHLVDAADWPDP